LSESAEGAPASMRDARLVSTEVIVGKPKRFVRERLVMPDGYEVDWYYTDTPPSVLVVPVTEAGNLVMVRQYRHNLKRRVLEFPAGVVDDGEGIEEAALRELLEETGYRRAEGCRLRPLGAFYSLPSETNKYTHAFLAETVERAGPAQGDAVIERYFDMEVAEISLGDALASIGGDICGMEAVAVISLARPLVERWNGETRAIKAADIEEEG
jgi:ADP-ribose pyrophosphatase